MAKRILAPRPGDAKDLARYRAEVEQSTATLTAVPNDGMESDPYIVAQVKALKLLIDSSKDAQGTPTMCGPIEFLMRVMNDPQVDHDARIKAANTLIQYFHKKVPSALFVTQTVQPENFDYSCLSQEELKEFERILLKLQSNQVERTVSDLRASSATQHGSGQRAMH